MAAAKPRASASPFPRPASERDSLDRAITPLTKQYRELRDQLADHELAEHPPWLQQTLGERPANWQTPAWDQAARSLARYRLDHDITDPNTALGPQPERGPERTQWEQARGTLEQDQRQLGYQLEHDIGIDIDLG